MLLELLSFSHSAEHLRARNDRLNRDASRGALIGLKARLTARSAQPKPLTRSTTPNQTMTVAPAAVSLAAR